MLEKGTAGTPRQNRLLASLSKSDFELVLPWLSTMVLKQGVLLQEAGEPIENVYFPHSGMVSLLAVMKDGAAVELATIGREGVTAAMAGVGMKQSISRAVVQLPGEASRISAKHFRNAAGRSNSLHDMIIRQNESLMAQVQYTAACNALHTVEARLGRWILQTRDRAESDEIPLTQEFLAEMLGVRRTTVTLVAQTLQEAGLIQYRRGTIKITDREALEHASCECYRTIRETTEHVLVKRNNH